MYGYKVSYIVEQCIFLARFIDPKGVKKILWIQFFRLKFPHNTDAYNYICIEVRDVANDKGIENLGLKTFSWFNFSPTTMHTSMYVLAEQILIV